MSSTTKGSSTTRLQPAALAAPSLVLSSFVFVARAEDAFAGKTISLLVSSDDGGGFVAYTCLLAPYMPKDIPEAPTIIVQNMPGGVGLRLTPFLYLVADKDGTKIGNVRVGNVLDSILNIRGGDMDPTRFEWIGNMACDPDVCVSSGTRLVLESLKICGRAKRLLARPAREAELFVPNCDELCAWHKNEDHPHSYPRGMFQLSHR
jgi:hypothetical protein